MSFRRRWRGPAALVADLSTYSFPQMAATHLHCPYDAEPETALAAIAQHQGPIFVDLDETLYLRNSTEDFLDQARPGLLALLFLRLLDVMRPWKLTGGDATRDTWRVRVIWILFPWTQALWRARVRELAREFSNQPLANALEAHRGRTVIITLGFQPIVTPLVAALGFPEAVIVASRISSFEDRRKGKLNAAMIHLGDESIAASLFVTDSLDDLSLLDKCARPLRTIWPNAGFRRALQRVYLPGEYLSQVKRPGERYIWRVILQEDLAFWVLSSLALARYPLVHCIALGWLLVAFWAVYERGYVDNDRVAEHFESDGKLTGSYWHSPVATPPWQPWIWATACAAVGCYLLALPGPFPLLDLARYMVVLIATYLTFKIYNRLDKASRAWLFAALQFARAAAFLALVPAVPIAWAALGALVLARWLPYYVYRLIGSALWPELQVNLIRLLYFVLLSALLVAIQGFWVLGSWTASALLAWNIFRARSELTAMFQASRRIDQRNAGSRP